MTIAKNPSFNLDENKSDTILKILKYGDNIRDKLLEGVSDKRQKAWANKARIASLVLAGTAHPLEIQTIQTEVEERKPGETVQSLAEKQFAKSIKLQTLDNAIEGMTQRAIADVNACTSDAQISDVISSYIPLARAKLAALMAQGGAS